MKCKYDHCRFHEVQGLNLEYTKLGVETFCQFHLPLVDENDEKTPKAKWEGSALTEFNNHVIFIINFFTNIKNNIDLSNVVFPGEIKFQRVNFKEVNFSNAIFYKKVNFDSLRFIGNANFSKCLFKKGVSFRGCKFDNELILDRSEFHSHVNFQNALFADLVSIKRTKFMGKVDFSMPSSTINKVEDRYGTFPYINFENSIFGDETIFINRRFLTTTYFSGCTFKMAPQFQGCQLHEDTTFPSEKNFQVIGDDKSASAYRTLKLAMESIRARNEEAMFSALEQKCIHQNPNTPMLFKFFSCLYRVTTDYGQSIWCVFRSFLFALFSFFAIYFFMAIPPITSSFNSYLSLINKVFIFNLKQSIPPYHAYNRGIPDWFGSEPNNDFLEIIFNLQTTLNLALLALLVLVLRWRFKRG